MAECKQAYSNTKYQFSRMKNGEVYELPIPKGVKKKVFLQRIRAAACGFRRRHQSAMKFTTELVESNDRTVVQLTVSGPESPSQNLFDDLFE